MTTALLIIIGILLFNLVVFAHELGHFFTAKSFGIKVNEFAIGMGPQIFKFTKNDTVFSLRLFPIGGFCSMEGEDEESSDPSAFGKKAAWKRTIVVVTGAIMNIILGFLMTLILLAQSPKLTSTTIAGFQPNAVSPSSKLAAGDEILKIDGAQVYSYKDLAFDLTVDGKSNFDIEVKRGNETVNLKNVIFKTEVNEKGKSVTILDFYLKATNKNFWTLIKQTFFDTISTVKIVWMSLVGIITGRFAFNNISGPIGITSVIGQASAEGLKTSFLMAINNIIAIMAMITINLGVVNLLPLPALDGGRLIFLIFEMITRKKINPKYEGWIHAVGFFLFIALMILISYSDIVRLLGWI